MSRRPLGRDTRATKEAWGQIAATIAEAPSIMRGAYPKRSPGLRHYRNPRNRAQLIGCCVGESGAAMGETTVRTPEPLEGPPRDAMDFSALWVYSIARAYTRTQGIRLGGEGAIVSHALQAVQEEGLISYNAWPSTEANYAGYRDGSVPKAAKDAQRIKVAGKIARLTDPDQVLEYLGAGYSIWIGVPWRGGQRTGNDGSFAWGKRSIGGHAVELLDYDLEADQVWIGNSWDNAGWGVQPGGVGVTAWSDLARDLSGRSLSNGASEACVITEFGWAPKIPDWADVL